MSEIDGAADAIADMLPDLDEEQEFSQETDELVDEPTHEGADQEEEEVETVDDALEEAEEGTEEEDQNIETLQELADALELPLEELQANLTSTFKASGEEITVTLAELHKSYQNEADYRKKSMSLGDERRGFEAKRQQEITQFQANHAGLADMTRAAGDFLKAEFNSPQLAQLRESNPAEWQARRSELQQQFDQLGRIRQEASANYEKFHTGQSEAFIEEQGKILAENVEGWGEEKLTEAVGVIKDLGFHDDELSSVVDARLFQGALRLKAAEERVRELEAKMAKGSEAAQKVKQKPSKILKAGKTAKVSKSKLASKRQALRKSAQGSKDNIRDAAAVIEELL